MMRISDWKVVVLSVVFLSALGFPGDYKYLFGDLVCDLFDYFCFFIEVCLILSTFKKDFSRVKKSQLLLYLLPLVFLGESLIVTNYLSEQLISCIRFMITVYFAIWISNNVTLEKVTDAFYRAQIIYLVSTLVFLIIKSGYSFENTDSVFNAFNGIWANKNECAYELVFGLIITIFSIRIYSKKSALSIGTMIIQIVLLALTKSTGACLFLVIIIAFVLFCKKRLNPGLVYIAITFGTLAIVFLGMGLLSKVLLLLGKNATLTGRVTLWRNIITLMTSNDLLHSVFGYGFSMFWRDKTAYSLLHSMVTNKYSWLANMTAGAHNGILDIWLNVGFVGVLFFLLVLVRANKSYKKWDYNKYLFVSSIMLFFTLHGLTERVIHNYTYSTLTIFLALAVATNNSFSEGTKVCSF